MSELAINAGTSQPVIENLQLQGFQFQTRMEMKLPNVPADITEIDDESLMQLFGELTAYANFLSVQFACAVIDEKNADQALDMEESKNYISSYEENKNAKRAQKCKLITTCRSQSMSNKGQMLQDPFLNALRKEHIPVSIYLVNGIKLQGQVESFDQYVVLLRNTVTQMVYKHAISTVVPARAVNLTTEDSESAE